MRSNKNIVWSISVILTFLFLLIFFTTVPARSPGEIDIAVDSTKYLNDGENSSDSLLINNSVSNNKTWNLVCPVLGFEVDALQETISFEDKAYGFCCKDCPRKFEKNPIGYSLNLSKDGKKFVGKKGLPQTEQK